MSLPSAPAREAALAVHALSPDHQQQLLARLSEPERMRIEPLLAELRALGVPAVTARRAVDGFAKPAPRDDDPLRNLSAATAAAALKRQSPAAVCAVLSAADWPWAPAAMSLLEPRQRQAVEALMHSGMNHAPAARAAWIAALGQAVQRARPNVTRAAKSPSLIQRVRSWMQ